MGATTIWERWDSMLPDGTINPGQMTSFNHYALGAVADWMHRTIGGIAPLEPGYARVLVAPRPGGGITWARAALETRQGPVSVSWQQEPAGGLTVEVEVPESVTALVRLPDGSEKEVGAGHAPAHQPVPDDHGRSESVHLVRPRWVWFKRASATGRGPISATFTQVDRTNNDSIPGPDLS